MSEFTAQDAVRSPWDPALKGVAVRRLLIAAAALMGVAVVGGAVIVLAGLAEAAILWLLLVLAPIATAGACAAGAGVISSHAAVGRLLQKGAFVIFMGGVAGMIVFAWLVALLFQASDSVLSAHAGPGPLTVNQVMKHLPGGEVLPPRNDPPFWTAIAAYLVWPFQFRLVRDVIGLFGVLAFISLVAMFGIWWERKVAGRIQSRLGPMRVGGWHGWAQSLADGIKLLQKEDLCHEGSDRPLFKLAPYIAFVPVLTAFVALPFSAAWVFRDLDVGLIFILAMVGVSVVGVLLAGWASNNKWSVYGAMREACQMVSYEIPMGMSLLIPVMTAGTLRLTEIGELQKGGFHDWLAFANPFTFIAAVAYFVASLASVKRAPFDLPEAESELVSGYHTEYSGFRWSLFFFAEYAEMFIVAGLATLLFFGAWHSPLPASWGAAMLEGPLWQRALYGLVFNGPIWFILKSGFFFYVQIWLRWTLPRVRLDQVMYACVQVLLPLTMVVLLGNTLWELLVAADSLAGRIVNLLLTGIGAVLVLGFVAIMLYGFANRKRLVGTLAIDHLPGA